MVPFYIFQVNKIYLNQYKQNRNVNIIIIIKNNDNDNINNNDNNITIIIISKIIVIITVLIVHNLEGLMSAEDCFAYQSRKFEAIC